MNPSTKPYRLLPFRFERKGEDVLMVNDVGKYHFIAGQVFDRFCTYEFESSASEYLDLESGGFSYREHPAQVIEWLATRYRTKKRHLFDFTALHMFVVTQRCNQRCAYCHASSVVGEKGSDLDMSIETARRSVEMTFSSPSRYLKIELQGGEPLLNFEVVKEIIEYSRQINVEACRELEVVLCTNLIALDEEKATYLKDNDVAVSTSLDGSQALHDSCRKMTSGAGSYGLATSGMRLLREELGYPKLSALTTVTAFNVDHLREVVDEYVAQGLGSIFLRSLNPFGRAKTQREELGYTAERYLSAYADALDCILKLNLSGRYLREEYATILLTKILTPHSTGFVDLQSPAGCGIAGAIYDSNGDIYVSDEARMLARGGDTRFCIGNVHSSSWKEAFGGSVLREVIAQSCIESLPGCAWCVYQPYCGCDPVRNYGACGNLTIPRYQDGFCRMNRGIFDLLFRYLKEADERILDVFWSWVTGRPLDEVWKK